MRLMAHVLWQWPPVANGDWNHGAPSSLGSQDLAYIEDLGLIAIGREVRVANRSSPGGQVMMYNPDEEPPV